MQNNDILCYIYVQSLTNRFVHFFLYFPNKSLQLAVKRLMILILDSILNLDCVLHFFCSPRFLYFQT